MSALPERQPCPSRSNYDRLPCQLDFGHGGSHRHVDPVTGGVYWSDVPPVEQPKREESESA